MKHIAVIGAGVTGVTTCYALLQRGYTVTLIERNRYAAMQTSFANGGQLSASNAEVWNTPATLLKGLRWMLRKDAPLLLNPVPGWHKYTWMAEFAANISRYQTHTVETVELAIAAREHLFGWAEKEGIHFDHKDKGILHIYPNEKGFRHAERVNRLLERGGLERYPVTAEEIKNIEPAIQGEFFGGFFTPSDSTGDIHLYTRGLADACKRLGANCCFDTSVESLKQLDEGMELELSNSSGQDRRNEKFDAVVLCAGVGSRNLAAMVGDRVNIYPVKGYSVTVKLDDAASQEAAPTVSLLDDDAKIVTSRLGDTRFRIAGTAEFNGVNYDIRADRIAPLVDWCRQYFPGISTSQVVPWAGLRPMMPGMLPRVGASKRNQALFFNTGHGHLGWTLSAATAELVADAVLAADTQRSGTKLKSASADSGENTVITSAPMKNAQNDAQRPDVGQANDAA